MAAMQARTVFLTGDLDLSCMDDLRGALDRALETSDDIQVDLSGARIVDSMGIRELLRAQALAVKAGKKFGVVAPSPKVRRLLRAANAAGLLTSPPLSRC